MSERDVDNFRGWFKKYYVGSPLNARPNVTIDTVLKQYVNENPELRENENARKAVIDHLFSTFNRWVPVNTWSEQFDIQKGDMVADATNAYVVTQVVDKDNFYGVGYMSVVVRHDPLKRADLLEHTKNKDIDPKAIATWQRHIGNQEDLKKILGR